MFKRALHLPEDGQENFILWGSRQSGKSTLLKALYGNSFWIDLLKSDQYRTYLQAPHLLRERIHADLSIRHVVIDEIQKIPALLDEVHWLIENSCRVRRAHRINQRDAARLNITGSMVNT